MRALTVLIALTVGSLFAIGTQGANVASAHALSALSVGDCVVLASGATSASCSDPASDWRLTAIVPVADSPRSSPCGEMGIAVADSAGEVTMYCFAFDWRVGVCYDTAGANHTKVDCAGRTQGSARRVASVHEGAADRSVCASDELALAISVDGRRVVCFTEP